MDDTTNKIEIKLDQRNLDLLSNLSRWAKWTGLIIVFFGLFYCLAVLTAESSFIGSLITLGIGILIVFIGSRLTAASGYIRKLVQGGHKDDFIYALDNMRQFFKMSGIIIGFFTIMAILTLIAISVFGLGVEELFNS